MIQSQLSFDFTEEVFTRVYFTVSDIMSAVGGFFALITLVLGKLAIFGLIYYFYNMIKVIKKRQILRNHKNELKNLKENLPELRRKLDSHLIYSKNKVN